MDDAIKLEEASCCCCGRCGSGGGADEVVGISSWEPKDGKEVSKVTGTSGSGALDVVDDDGPVVDSDGIVVVVDTAATDALVLADEETVGGPENGDVKL